MSNDKLDLYETTNIVLAATLVCHGCQVAHITLGGRNGTMGIFAFNGATQTMLAMFDQGRLTVDPTIFNMHMKRLTSMTKAIAKDEMNG